MAIARPRRLPLPVAPSRDAGPRMPEAPATLPVRPWLPVLAALAPDPGVLRRCTVRRLEIGRAHV